MKRTKDMNDLVTMMESGRTDEFEQFVYNAGYKDVLDTVSCAYLDTLADKDRIIAKMRKQRTAYRNQLKGLLRAHRLLKLEYKELKRKHDEQSWTDAMITASLRKELASKGG